MQFDGVAARVPGAPGRLTVLLDDRRDLLDSELTTDLARRLAESWRGTHGLNPLDEGKRLRPRVADLRRQLGAMRVNGVHELLEARDQAVIPQTDALHDVREALIDGDRLEDDQPHPALGPGLQVVDHLVGNAAVGRRPVRRHGSHRDPVLDLHRADLDGAEELGQGRHFASPLPNSSLRSASRHFAIRGLRLRRNPPLPLAVRRAQRKVRSTAPILACASHRVTLPGLTSSFHEVPHALYSGGVPLLG